jgi:hypothetical protein
MTGHRSGAEDRAWIVRLAHVLEGRLLRTLLQDCQVLCRRLDHFTDSMSVERFAEDAVQNLEALGALAALAARAGGWTTEAVAATHVWAYNMKPKGAAAFLWTASALRDLEAFTTWRSAQLAGRASCAQRAPQRARSAMRRWLRCCGGLQSGGSSLQKWRAPAPSSP